MQTTSTNQRWRLLPVLFFFTFVLQLRGSAQESNLVEVAGRVVSAESRHGLAGVSVGIKGSVTGSVTNDSGYFALRTRLRFPFTLNFSTIGYQPQEYEVRGLDSKINVELFTQTQLGTEVVVTASRVSENILKSPVAIEKLDIRAIKEAAAPSFYDALENVKGVQMLTSSLTFKVPNTRGFNVPNNFRFLQLVDGVDMQAATLGVPLGNAIGATELDIEAVEITPGAASALYGMNAINGIANLQTKSPFKYPGLSVYQKIGVNHVDGIDRDPSALTETAIRYAKVIGNRFAFKLNFSTLKGTDWVANGLVDQNPQNLGTANPRFPELAGEANPARDQWSRYGDDRQARQAISVNYKGVPETFNVARTGYLEKDLIYPDVRNLKLDGALFYRLNDKLEASYSYRYGIMDGVFQRGNRIQLNDVTVQNHKVELRSADFLARVYVLKENTGKSYNLNPLAYSLDLSHASNAVWGSTFKGELQRQLDANVALTDAMQAARAAADAGRAEPGTAAFNQLKNTIVNSNNWDVKSASLPNGAPNGGAAVWQYSNTYHADLQYHISRIKWANVLVGGDYRLYEVIPDGNTFVDLSRPLAERTVADKNGSFGEKQYYRKYGVFAQVTKLFFDDKLKVSASARVDRNPEFSTKLNPRLAVVYTAAQRHNFRASFQNGYRFPALFEALSFLNNASVRRVGGLARVNEGIGFLENSYTLASLDRFTAAVANDVRAGLTNNDAALKNRNVLQAANLPVMQPESINSFEIGYKSVLANNKLVLDWDAYYNIYGGFLGQVEVAVPTSGTIGSDAAVLDMTVRNKQNRYRVYTNARNKYNSYGSSLGVTYNFYKRFTVTGNLNYNKLSNNPNPDIFQTSFNTPAWITNVSFSNREIIKNVGFNIVWRWQDVVFWESTLANGQVPAYSTIDAQVNVRFPKLKSTVKVGGTNLLNQRFIQFAAGPTIGALYYAAVTVDGLLK
ncbi:TonB-dependent Receptor Plug Domain [Cnuella takakiae]|uniref:TonB-dependent Receptor Plug Domain n=1 Tax=Cnuella takakiae TaxID=1302690 RepID=A0A1M5G5A3_9BACT|nr:TonB-dependent receptor [Cnuella takakiae]OLY92329.1 energy transducer TonB [Cnuella takakiae]SHF98631.1 TonB-dependent Receptor Plug Domain [Cnuella takakiae]